MILYEATNGWMGNSYVRCLVIAENETEAIEVAREAFKKEDKKPSYWRDVSVISLCSDTSRKWRSRVTDE